MKLSVPNDSGTGVSDVKPVMSHKPRNTVFSRFSVIEDDLLKDLDMTGDGKVTRADIHKYVNSSIQTRETKKMLKWAVGGLVLLIVVLALTTFGVIQGTRQLWKNNARITDGEGNTLEISGITAKLTLNEYTEGAPTEPGARRRLQEAGVDEVDVLMHLSYSAVHAKICGQGQRTQYHLVLDVADTIVSIYEHEETGEQK